jgi:hypothetical protein
MIAILDNFIISLLGIWLFLTIVAQFSGIRWIKWIIDRDPFDLIPSWTFFAPNPIISDYQILYRDKLFNGQFSNWEQVQYRDYSIFHSILNPDKRRRKAIAGYCKTILKSASKNLKNEAITSSYPYLVILTYIMSMPKNHLCEYRQFLIARSFGYKSSKQPDILFISNLHNLSSNS